jgi:hypothetical protein
MVTDYEVEQTEILSTLEASPDAGGVKPKLFGYFLGFSDAKHVCGRNYYVVVEQRNVRRRSGGCEDEWRKMVAVLLIKVAPINLIAKDNVDTRW